MQGKSVITQLYIYRKDHLLLESSQLTTGPSMLEEERWKGAGAAVSNSCLKLVHSQKVHSVSYNHKSSMYLHVIELLYCGRGITLTNPHFLSCHY